VSNATFLFYGLFADLLAKAWYFGGHLME
jgi:hypothetical protein